MNCLLIRPQEGMQLVMVMILHVRIFGVSVLLYSPVATKYTGPLISRGWSHKLRGTLICLVTGRVVADQGNLIYSTVYKFMARVSRLVDWFPGK